MAKRSEHASGLNQRVASRVALGLAIVLLVPVVGHASGTVTGGAARSSAGDPALARSLFAAPLIAPPAYFRPVVVRGKAFPVARSNHLSLIEFPNSWLAPRLRLVNGTWRLIGVHLGIDISAERGAPILSMVDGVVENAGWTFYSGTRVGVRGTDGRYYLYAHLSSVQPGIAPGAAVSAGSVLGLVGNTGYGPPGHRDEFPSHLHFGIESGSEWVNPYPSLVSLYSALVGSTRRWQASLDRLAAEGRRADWNRQVEQVFMHPPAGAGE